VAASLVGLVYVARQAFEEKRRRQCLEITAAILKIDPEHAEARKIQDAVRGELTQEFVSAQALAREARSKHDQDLYIQAEGTLRKIVEADPDNLEAKTLLLNTVSYGYFHPSEEVETVEAAASPSGWRARRGTILMGSVAVIVFATVFALSKGNDPQISRRLSVPKVSANTETRSDPSAPKPFEPTLESTQFPVISGSSSTAFNDALVVGDLHTVNIGLNLPPDQPPAPTIRIESVDRTLRPTSPPLKSAVPPAPNAAMGSLAVNASVPVDIYRADEHLGSTPVTLQLPPGVQTLEYRYQGFHQTVSHVIKSQETTTAVISFMIKVEINARPWAQVSIEGTQLRPLGQTPLGDVSVPIGSVLVFQNPGFPIKRYRVTARDTAIQVAFP